MTPRDTFTIGDVATRCDVSMKTVRRAVRSGELPAVRFNRQVVRIARRDVELWLDRGRVRAMSTKSASGNQ